MTRPVIHIDGERGLRGGERQLLYLAAALARGGREGVIACRRNSPLAKEARRQGLETLPLPFLFEWDPLSALSLRREAKRRGALIHAHTAHAAALASLTGLPFVAHRRVDFHLSGGLSRRLKYERAAKVVAVSEAIARILQEDGLAKERIAVVPDSIPSTPEEARWAGLPTNWFEPPAPEERQRIRRELSAELNIPSDAHYIGNIAALVPHKDHDTLLAAALLVLMKRRNAYFLIAGQGPEEGRLWAQVKNLGLAGRVLLLGQREDPARLLKAFDLFALSSWGEGMGSVLLEAAACGVPVAATTAGGIPEVVEDGATGLLCPPRSAEALAGNLERLLDDAALGRRLAEEARRRLPRFGLEAQAARMGEVYDSLA